DEDFADVEIVADAAALYKDADLIFKVTPPTVEELGQMKDGCTLVGFMVPSKNADMMKLMCDKKITSLAMELVPRITRAQSMDALSSQA
ncbi:PREDICTED: NAD(P) transhydrogenase subunit alpha-like, partial [Priapulus caudatus]|uniref:proton-translocating NAD(P)(+) transhydrogenase n=1 Tax=Priapulus caudatus TaxID=37621 RepID=A0ABM1F842_PRICU